jgi:hypothetical protein
MRIHIVNYEETFNDGILTKHAKEMQRVCLDEGHECTRSHRIDPKADINHHINYAAAQPCPTLNTTMITHFTSDMFKHREKLDMVRKFLVNGIGICFSQGVLNFLVKQGMPREKLRVVLPAHDGRKRRPRIIAIAFNVYPDGRKREYMFTKLIGSLKDQKKFAFRIMGTGWKPVLDPLAKKGLQVQWVERFMGDIYDELLNTSDYILYTGGEDAIAQCIVDAKNSALRIIAPVQEDVEVDIPFETQAELNKIFRKMEDNPVEDWTWEKYTKQHIEIWKEMMNKKKVKIHL